MDYSRGDTQSALSGIFTSTGFGGMLEREEYQTIDIFFTILEGFTEKASGISEPPSVTRFPTFYNYLLSSLIVYNLFPMNELP